MLGAATGLSTCTTNQSKACLPSRADHSKNALSSGQYLHLAIVIREKLPHWRNRFNPRAAHPLIVLPRRALNQISSTCGAWTRPPVQKFFSFPKASKLPRCLFYVGIGPVGRRTPTIHSRPRTGDEIPGPAATAKLSSLVETTFVSSFLSASSVGKSPQTAARVAGRRERGTAANTERHRSRTPAPLLIFPV